MKPAFCFLSLIVILVSATMSAPRAVTAVSAAPPEGYDQLKAQAEAFYADHSYAKAQQLYAQAEAMELSPAEARWVDFRLADTKWRAQAGTRTADSTVYDEARRELEALVNTIQRVEDRDLVWAEANESLGDFWWERPDSQNWNGWNYYQQALDWWAGSDDLNRARERYLHMVWTATEPAWRERHSYYGSYSNVPLNVLDNALKIANTDNDKAHASYLIALALLQYGGDWHQQQRIPKAFEGALSGGKSTEWYDDALFAYAQWLNNSGPVELRADGSWTRRPDYVKALELAQRLVREFRKGETRYYDDAKSMIEQITAPALEVAVSSFLLPDSEIQFHLRWRNVKQIDLALYQVDLTRELNFKTSQNAPYQWLDFIDLGGAEKVKEWVKQTEDQGDHQHGQSHERLDQPLPVGAYVVEASAGGKKARELVLVTDAAVILKAAGDQALVFVCNAVDSTPQADATVRLWKLVHDDNRWHAASAEKRTDKDGLCAFTAGDFANLPKSTNVHYFAAVAKGDRQALAQSNVGWYSPEREPWRIYAFTDRPAYRPQETVQWKLIARTASGTGYATPAGQSIEYEITDPHGSKVHSGTAVLNDFGSAWGSLDLTTAMPLGEYHVNYWKDKNHNEHIGGATLFRLEEYKLPEFRVTIATPEENGRKKTFLLGEYVEVNIQADYYFGGPVANANVEIVVYQDPFYRWWHPKRDYPWVYEDENPYRWWGGGGQIVKRETLKTDVQGRAVLTFDTPANAQQDYEYRIEARVTDASRREIIGSDKVRVTRQRYYVNAQPKHYLHRPGDQVEIDFKGLDANDEPVSVEGKVKVFRDEWIEIWIDPTGREIAGTALHEIRTASRIFPPPPPNPDAPPWRCKFRGYKSEEVLSTTVKLDDKGEATFAFTPETEGYYRVTWRSDDPGAPPVTTETTVWVAKNETTELGYRHGGLQIIVDKDTFKAGESAPVMISTSTNNRYVLFSVEGDDLHSYQVIHVTGTVKLIHVPIDQRHIPNVYLSASMAHDGQLHQDTEQVFIPPVKQYLNVEVVADRSQYQPGEEGQFTVTTKDHEDKPISAEVALAVVDEAVTYIQQDYAGDPRAFFFDRRQSHVVQTGSTFQQKGFIRLVEGENEQLMDERQAAQNQMADNERARRDGSAPSLDMDSKVEQYASKSVAGRRGGGSGGSLFGEAAAAADAINGLAGQARLEERAPGEGKDLGELAPVQVRSDFRSTLLWEPSIVTDEDGTARVTLKYADALTTWKATARAAGKGNQFGIASAATKTKMPLIARLQAPRFFVVGDTVIISGVVNNNTDEALTVTPSLEAEGLTIVSMLRDGQPTKGDGTLEVAANSEGRVDWQIAVESAGDAKLKFAAQTTKYADAMEKQYTVYEHGVERLLGKAGKARGDDITVRLDIPAERKPESTALMVQVAPSMAVTMLDALPYLIDYPYGCTEQTMSRFLPAVITAKTLNDLGVKPEAAMAKVFGGIEQAHVDKTHPKGKQDLKQLDVITQAGLDRLYDFQHGDGGWGWWKEGESDHFMTAYVLWGLTLAKDAGLDVKEDVMHRAASFLDVEIVEQETHPDMQAWMLHALAAHQASFKRAQQSEPVQKAIDNLWRQRDKLNAYTRALFALATHELGDAQKAKTLVENLENGVKRDDRPDTSAIIAGGRGQNDSVLGTAHWGEDGVYWRWSDGGVEATAFALRAILAIDPKNKLIEPVTNWLVKNRRGAQWSNTRDTAITVLALNDYLRTSGELTANLEYELTVNGHAIVSKKLSAEDALSAPSRFNIPLEYVRDGANDIRIVRKSGGGAIYFSAEASFFSLEEPVPASGNEIFVRREYYRLSPKPTLLKGYVYDRVPVMDGGTIASGERVEVVLTIEAKNNYEYLVFEDLKPAGLEAVEVRSGSPVYAKEMKSGAIKLTFGDGERPPEDVMAEQGQTGQEDFTGRQQWVYQELRDRKVALFIDRLPEGVWEIRYDLRAEVPGRFHALPVLGHAMYVPEIKCNGAEIRVAVTERTSD